MTAEDIKWSLDRAVLGQVAGAAAAADRLASPAPTSSRSSDPHDDRRVTLEKPDRLALANLCVPYAIMINSKLARQHATADDPWAQEWMKTNTAACGAYIVESHKPGESTILRRNEKWTGGPDGQLPFFRRIIVQTVPEPATRANLIERGDADLAIDLAASDIPSIEKSAQVEGRLDPADQRLHPHHHEHARWRPSTT